MNSISATARLSQLFEIDLSCLQNAITSEKVACFCRAGPSVGGGHITRCLALLREIEEQGARCIFICDQNTHEVIDKFKECSEESKYFDVLEESKFSLRGDRFDICILDDPWRPKIKSVKSDNVVDFW